VSGVQAAMKQAGLTGFKPIPRADFSRGKQTPGVTPDDILGAFQFLRTGGMNSPEALAYTVVVARDPSIVPKLKAEIKVEGHFRSGEVKTVEQGNVLVSWLAVHPTTADKATVAQLEHLTSDLRGS
jgi:hypothetical protein